MIVLTHLLFLLATGSSGVLKLMHDGKEEAFSLSFKMLLAFATGAPCPPPVGYSPQPSLAFSYNGNKYPKSNTCSNTIYLPMVYTSIDDFCYYMAYGITNAVGFGRV